jgi:hypothetical protein
MDKNPADREVIRSLAEQVVMRWLTKVGFEAVKFGHKGMDIIAIPPKSPRLGLTLKSRARLPGGSEPPSSSVKLFDPPGKARKNLRDACDAFGCEPWVAVYVETEDSADLYLTSLHNFDVKYGGNQWKMSDAYKARYARDPSVRHVGMKFDAKEWAWDEKR